MKVKAIKTAVGRLPMSEDNKIKVYKDDSREGELICIYPDIEYQTVKGFGGAFTEAAATTLDKLDKTQRAKALELYFDPEKGIGYNFGRVHINSCDFSLGNYSCVDEGDNSLKSFNINRDKKSVIPMIKDAMKYNNIDIFASPWSPPGYMKTSGEMNHGGRLKPEYYELWSEYYVKFIEEYKKEGICINSITVQNEPKAVQSWDSCVYTAEEERDFVKNYLGAKMKKIGVDVLFWDHNKERIVDRSKTMLSDKDAAEYISGIAFHWYSGDHFEQLEMFHNLYPNKEIVFSEGCYEYSRGALDTVKIGERYAHDMIGNFNNYCNSFCDWNLILDEKGGPNHVGNFCDAPIMINTQTGEIEIHDSYYYIGHFSKFIKQDAKRIGSSKWTDAVETVSFKNPDGEIVTVVLNRTDKNIKAWLKLDGQLAETEIEAHSIATYIFTTK